MSLYGPEASKHLFRCLVSSVDLTSDGRSYGKDGQQLQMLCQEANSLISKPNFVSILCYGFEKQENKVIINLYVVLLRKTSSVLVVLYSIQDLYVPQKLFLVPNIICIQCWEKLIL